MTIGLALVDLETAKQHLRVDHDDDDVLIQFYIEAATSAVLAYLKAQGTAGILDSDGQLASSSSEGAQVPSEVVWAVIFLVGLMFRDRDGATIPEWQPGYLPAPVVSILYPLRDPALA